MFGSRLSTLAPALAQLLRYRRQDLGGDVVAGITVAVMYVPQGMAYAILAGLPPVVGLYAATIPLLVYGLLGSSPQLAVGPVAVVSLMVYTACSGLAEPGSPEYIGLAALLALFVGVIMLAMGLVRLGFIVRFMSHAVISGFTSAAAILIGLSQLPPLLGVKLEGGHSGLKLIGALVPVLADANLPTVALGAASVVLLVVLARWLPKIPGGLLVVVGCTAATWYLGLHEAGVRIVGEVPLGLPPFALPALDAGAAQSLAPAAFTIAFVGFMESIAVAKYLAAKERTKVEPDAELRALGAANLAAGVFSGYPVTGGLSRTAVNYRAGARTSLASLISASFVLLTLAFLTPAFYYLPSAALAAIIIVAVAGMVDIQDAVRLFRIKSRDGWVLLATFAVTLGVGIEQGILAGIVLSLLFYIWQSSRPHTAELGYLAGRRAFLNVGRYPEAVRFEDVIILRVDSSLYFANMEFVGDILRRRIASRPDVRWVVLDFSGVNDMDAVAVLELEEIMEGYGEHGVRFLLARVKGPVRDVLDRAGWYQRRGGNIEYPNISSALKAVGSLRPLRGSVPEENLDE